MNVNMIKTLLYRYRWAIGMMIFDLVISGGIMLSAIFMPVILIGPFKLVWSAIFDKAALQRDKEDVAFFVLSGVLMVTLTILHFNYTQAQMKRVVKACEQYQQETGQYPDHLNQLVPNYLPAIPRLRLCLGGEQQYYSRQGKHLLSVTIFPPFGRKIYDLEKKSMEFLD